MGGVVKGLLGGGKSSSELQVKEAAGIFGEGEKRKASKRLGTTLEQLLTASPEQQSFAPQSASEQAIISSLIDLTQGQTAVRGLGPATQGSLTQAIAPTLVGFRESEAQRGLQKRQQDIAGLLELAGLASPQILAGQQSTQKGPGLLSGVLGGLASGFATGFGESKGKCWVADVLYGPDATKTYFARLYANSHDTLFLRLYGKYGKSWARWLNSHRWAQPIVKPIWDIMATKGARMLREV